MAKDKHPRRNPRQPRSTHGQHGLPELSVVVITAIGEDGELVAEPVEWDRRRKPPHITVRETSRQRAASIGDRVLAKLRKLHAHQYQGQLIRILPAGQERPVLGIFRATPQGGLIEPVSRKEKESFLVARADCDDAQPGELVAGVTLGATPRLGLAQARITERLGRLDTPRAASLIASHMHALPMAFSPAALAEAEAAPNPVPQEGRDDLRALPLVTIDGEDARDFDDAVFAEPDGAGWHIVVAIADVSAYVVEGSALDADAYMRGNSVYFPDRVIPMLPERLSNGLCSLKPEEDRYCLAVHLWLDEEGNRQRYRFVRGLMRSVARLTYVQVSETRHQKSDVSINHLFGAYAALARERDRRGALDLDLPEYKIAFDEAGNVSAIAPRERLESHRLIEAFMIAANVAAADFLLEKHLPAIYRAHEPPSPDKLDEVRQFLQLSGYNLQKGGVHARHFNRILRQSEQEPNQLLVHTAVLRAQTQAWYSHENIGHFGLSLQKYAHFTSPIRRYADLVVHRALVAALRGEPYIPTISLAATAQHISDTERRAMLAERDASDRYKVSFMAKKIGQQFEGVINSLNDYGLFVALRETGVTGFVPVRNLPGDFYVYDKRHACFKGQRSKRQFVLGQPLLVRVQEANAITGSLIFVVENVKNDIEKRPFTKRKNLDRLKHKRH